MDDDQPLRFSLRLPKDLHDRLTAAANEGNNSLNSEMLRLLELGLERASPKAPDKGLIDYLPPAMIWRVSRFKASRGLSSDEEAAKRLIKIALDDTESAKDILDKLADSYRAEKDLRILARDVIAAHSAVDSLIYGNKNEYIWFKTKAGESGAIAKKGDLHHSEYGSAWDDRMEYYEPAKGSKAVGGWDARPGADLDEDIPF